MAKSGSSPITEEKIFSVSELNSFVHIVLEENFAPVWITGEISNLVQPNSGHIYFSLKDNSAAVRCVMFRGHNTTLNFKPKNGDHVNVYAQISLYEARGDYQLLVYKMEDAGLGILHKKFLQLKEKLAKEGLFDQKYKKLIPKFPNCIGVITSPTGAAIRDILSVLKRRFPGVSIIIYPTQVQGSEASAQIVDAIEIANLRNECDVLLLARGGGSIEDLWQFNEEIVARAIFASDIPIVSGIGHEIDFTIADFVADVRAPTPSAAAELVVPDREELFRQINHTANKLLTLIEGKLERWFFYCDNLKQRLKHPRQILQQNVQRLDELAERLKLSAGNFLKHKNVEVDYLEAHLKQYNPFAQIKHFAYNVFTLKKRLISISDQVLKHKHQKLNGLLQILDTVSPLATLCRGYSILSKDGKILRSVKDVSAGDKINGRLSDGSIECEVL
jgi:exodeoxyribonuclease VII large subunit